MTLIYDIETWSYGQFDVNKDKFRTISLYELEQDKWHFYTYKEKTLIQELFNKHKIIVGFNNSKYDDPILKIYGIILQYHNNIDLREVALKRGAYIGLDETSLSLANIAKVLNLTINKDEDFNYELLTKDEWTPEELLTIRAYNQLDVQVTLALYNKFKEFFEPFKQFISKEDQENMSWLKSSVATYTYKVMCHHTGIKEEYDDNAPRIPYTGGYVAEPTVNEAHGNIYSFDFNSLYPHMYIMGNLASPTTEKGWNGGEFFSNLSGTYKNDEQGIKEHVLYELYKKRVEYKEQKNPLQYALKIVLNTFYGITGNPVFKNLYNHNTAHDCTKMGQTCIKYTRDVFEANGYQFLYTDTDSVYIIDPYKNKEKMLKVKNQIINKIKSKVPFPVETFDLKIEHEIKHIWFFKSGEHYKKKNYILVTNDDKLIIKGLPMIKRDGSKIGYYIFKKYIEQNLINNQPIHEYQTIKQLVYKEITENPNLVAKTFIVDKEENYKNPNQLQAQISKKYGAGKHQLIPNKYYGVGKTTKYCTVEEYQSRNYSPHCIILNKMWNELEPFINYKPPIHIIKKSTGQSELLEWTNIEV